jgi:hypothetical protein
VHDFSEVPHRIVWRQQGKLRARSRSHAVYSSLKETIGKSINCNLNFLPGCILPDWVSWKLTVTQGRAWKIPFSNSLSRKDCMDLNFENNPKKDYTREVLSIASPKDTDCSHQICLALFI